MSNSKRQLTPAKIATFYTNASLGSLKGWLRAVHELGEVTVAQNQYNISTRLLAEWTIWEHVEDKGGGRVEESDLYKTDGERY